MAVYKRGDTYHYEFIFAGKRIRESAHTTSKTIAKEAEKARRRALERTLAGLPVQEREMRIKSVADLVHPYLSGYELNHREKSIVFSKGRLAHVQRLVGTTLLPDLNESAIRRYIRIRLGEGASGRTVNMELGELSRAVGQPWSVLWPKVRKLEEQKDIGRALSPSEEYRLLRAVDEVRSPIIGPFVRIALLTGMRSGEILSLTWGQLDLTSRVVTVGRAKTSSGTGRQIPMNDELFAIMCSHAQWFTDQFGEAKPELYVFPFGSPVPNDPTRATTTIKHAWTTLRKVAGVKCRLHDLRHTAATKMAEAGAPESTMLSIMGHMSRAMLERYSHIRMAAKRDAVAALATVRTNPDSEPVPTKVPTIEAARRIQ